MTDLLIECLLYMPDEKASNNFSDQEKIRMEEAHLLSEKTLKIIAKERYGDLIIAYGDTQFVCHYEGVWYLAYLTLFIPELIRNGEKALLSELHDNYNVEMKMLPGNQIRICYNAHSQNYHDEELDKQMVIVPAGAFLRGIYQKYHYYLEMEKEVLIPEMTEGYKQRTSSSMETIRKLLHSMGITV